ncbi:autotransporter secretion inner membrane protein TamB [Roseibium hamelinense]|uniref:Autotransporter secretion inner membrane protein TamB n=1 Tax=Roseibium hamelinense TaxID=150831 RepID=A0A562T8M8_9HYPH|nr:translocation/assembly module TamB domain-containing protein [Roseibium hamelinense]MTI42984.1 hypothetical protein [Roseibium hamelinense]TWI89594.1 autotransporter secretion inner membrane protein TamB [Roseibium hamelinense]
MTYLKRFFRSLMWLVLIALALPSAVIAFLQFPVGQTFVSSLISSLASSEQQKIELTGLKLSFGLDVELESLTLADARGTWLEVDNAALAWAPLELLGRRVHVERLVADSIRLDRTPDAVPSDAPVEPETTGSGGFSMPFGLAVQIDRISVPEIDLGAPVIGTEIALAVNAAGSVDPSPLTLTTDLDVTRIDGVAGEITTTIAFVPDAETLRFDIRVQEPRGGLVARLAGIQDLPALDIELKGDGPLNDWATDLRIALDGAETASGSAKITSTEDTRRLSFDLDGQIERLAPPVASAFVLGTTDLVGNLDMTPDFVPLGGEATLSTQTVKADLKGTFNPDSQAVSANADISVSGGQGALIALDIDERRIAAGPVGLKASVSGTLENAQWSLDLTTQTLQTTEGQISGLTLNAGGTGADLQADALRVPFQVNLDINGVAMADPQLKLADGSISLRAAGRADGAAQSVSLDSSRLVTDVARLELEETTASAGSIVTSGTLTAPDLSVFSDVSGQSLEGALRSTFSADLDPSALTGTAGLSVSARDVKTGIAQADGLLLGETTLSADILLDTLDDIQVSGLQLAANGLSLTGGARKQQEAIQADLSGAFTDLSRLEPRVAGDMTFDLTASGTVETPEVGLKVNSDEILLAGTPLKTLAAVIDATVSKTEPSGSVEVSGELQGAPIKVTADLVSKDGGAVANPIDIRLASNRISGQMTVGDLARALQTLDGEIKVDAPDLSALSPLVLTDISGALSGDIIALPESSGSESLKMDLTATKVVVPGADIETLQLAASAASLTDTNSFRANVRAGDILAGSTLVKSAQLDVVPDGQGIKIDAMIALTEGGTPDGLDLSARLEQTSGGFKAALETLNGRYQELTTALAAPANLSYEGGTAKVDGLTLKLGSGQLSVAGTAGETLDMKAELKAIPLALANSVQPGLGLSGTLSGSVTASGTSADPKVVWSIQGRELTATEMRNNGLAAVSVDSNGTLSGTQITQKTVLDGGGGLGMTASGSIDIAAPGRLNIDLNGNAPLAALRRQFTQAGIRGEGAVSVAGKVTGSFSKPAYSLTVTPNGVRITSLNTGLTVQNVTGSVAVNQDGVSINQINGAVSSGGTLSANGTIGLGQGMPANINTKLNRVKYVDAGLVTAEIDADISVTGNLAGTGNAAVIGGSITIQKADISIPETLPGAVSPVAVRHVNAPKAVQQQIDELGGGGDGKQAEGTSNPPRLDITLNAPGRIFIRGRGLDAELGGNLRIVGTTSDPQAIGAFELRRGQLDVLTRRLVFSRGSATFSGSLTPVIDFLATTTVSDTTINVGVAGNADDPAVSFTSAPELPQDEVLSLLLFGRSVGNLSPTQIAQLASSIAVLTGGSDSGPLADIRKSLGLDVVDVNVDGDGGPSLAVGKYVNDNIYLGVEQGTGSGSSRVQVDIELDRGLKVRGEVGADGSSKAGIFFEREY